MIEEHLALITLLVVWSAIIGYSFIHVHPSPGMEAGQVITYVLTLVTISVMVSVIPAIAVMYGWHTGKPAHAALIGAILLPAIYVLVYLVLSHDNMVFIDVIDTVLYLSVLSIISGLAGYCAAQRTNRFLAVAIALIGVWFFMFTSGIN
ncbi:MAG: hypothetical protein M0Q92_11610 [Methanoregula sp.]|jgi:hypothetical protein|nr:hypothetical protein [Methanoregula sp.]